MASRRALAGTADAPPLAPRPPGEAWRGGAPGNPASEAPPTPEQRGRRTAGLAALAIGARALVRRLVARIALERLAPALEAANRQTYLEALQRHAAALAQPVPAEIADRAALEGIAQRARASAQSIVETRAARMADLVAQTGGRAAARPLFDAWQGPWGQVVARYEAAQTAAQAARDVIAAHGLSGTAHVEPTSSAGLDDACDAAIAAGEVPIEQIAIDLPAHVRCPHGWVYTLHT